MKRRWLHRIQWANVGLLALGTLNNSLQVFPDLQQNNTALAIQAILAALLPSLGGVSHKLDGSTVVEKGGSK